MKLTGSEPQKMDFFDPGLIFNECFNVGTIDLVQGGAFQNIISPIIIGSYFLRKNEASRDQVFSERLLILPPANVGSLTVTEIYESLFESVAMLSGKAPLGDEQEHIRKTLKIVTCQSLQFTDLFYLVSSAPKSSFIIISEAELYRSRDVNIHPKFGLTATKTREDDWVPHVAELCQLCVKTTKDIEGYAVLHVKDGPAIGVNNRAILNGIDDCYVIEVKQKVSADEILVKNIDRWVGMSLGAQLGQLMSEIKSLPVSDLNKKLLKAQILYRAGNEEDVLKLLYDLSDKKDELEAIQQIRLAKIAFDMGCSDLVDLFLVSDFDGLVSEFWFEIALNIAIDRRNNALIDLLDERLVSLFPGSNALRDNRDKRLMLNCYLFGIDKFQYTTGGFTENHLFILKSLSRMNFDIDTVLEEFHSLEDDWCELALICCAIVAEKNGELFKAIKCASQAADSKLYCRQGSQILLRLSRQLLLNNEVERGNYDFYVMPLEKIIRYISVFPNDSRIRNQLSLIFTVEVSGYVGLPLIVKLTLDQLVAGVRLSEAEVQESTSAPIFDEEECLRLIEKGLLWLSEQTAVEPGVTTLPVEMLNENADLVVRILKDMIDFACSSKGEDVDLDYVEKLVLLTCAITPFSESERNTDIQVLRHYACQLVINGRGQQARDLCEQALLLGNGSNLRKRLVWVMQADVYQRNHQPTFAFLSLACASSIDVEISARELCDEVYIVLRLLRDIGGLGELAVKTISKLKGLLVRVGIDPDNDAGLIITNWTMRLRELERIDAGELLELMREITMKCSENIEDRNFLFSASVLLAQVVKRCDELSIPVEKTDREMLTTAIDRLGQVNAQFVSALSACRPSPEMVVDLYNRVQHARYATDAPGDLRHITLLARTLLSGDLSAASLESAALAIELLVDKAIEYPVEPPCLSPEWPLNFSQDISKKNIDLIFIAINHLDELIVLYVSKDVVQFIEQPELETSIFERLQLWSRRYPLEYGYIDTDEGSNEYFTTMDELGIALPAVRNQILVFAEPIFHQLPLNLLLTAGKNEEFNSFVGENAAIGLAPSLSWLSQIQDKRRVSTKRYQAWIPAGEQGALKMLQSRIQDTLDEFEFILDVGSELPNNFSDSNIAVIAAHGGLTTDGKFIHTIRDEVALVENPMALANALSNVELVILFVCSGGRLDKHPLDHTAVGLPKLLLNKGCRTIIASPWPLDVMVTCNWLQPFMVAWGSGETALTATQVANKQVAKKLGNHPAYSLAMTVYGDPFLTNHE